MTRIAFTTLGCKVNQYDTAVMKASVSEGSAYVIVPFDEKADIYVVNTCTVTGKGDAESRRLIRRAVRTNSRARVIVTGCYAQTRPEEIADIDGVSMVLGNREKSSFMQMINLHEEGADRNKVFVSSISEMVTVPNHDMNIFSDRSRAFIKVQDGCDSRCSYCIVPFARGKSRSLGPREVIGQAAALSQSGYREIVLCGVHLGGYGRDLENRLSLAALIEMLLEETDIPRIRLSSIEPREISDDLIRLAASEERICRHFHIPLQSGDDQILKRMNRNYDAPFFENLVMKIREYMDDAGIGVDVMAGYPGEEDVHFHKTYEFIERMPLTYLHVFSYSPRPGTAAYHLRDRVRGDLIQQRSSALRSLGKLKETEFKRSQINKVTQVLVEDEEDELSGLSKGYTGNYLKTLIIPADHDLSNGSRRIKGGDFIKVKITGMINDDLSGTACN